MDGLGFDAVVKSISSLTLCRIVYVRDTVFSQKGQEVNALMFKRRAALPEEYLSSCKKGIAIHSERGVEYLPAQPPLEDVKR